MREQSRRSTLYLGIGLGLLLVYALPVYFPPGAQSFGAASSATPLIERLFPSVPLWWMVGRLLALAAGAALIAWTCPVSAIRFPGARVAPKSETKPWASRLALLAAIAQVACLPVLRQLPLPAKTLFLLWIPVPALILALGRTPLRLALRRGLPAGRPWVVFGGALIAVWIAVRLVASWHSPIAADCSDMFRTLGGLVRLATTDADVMTESMGVKEGVGDIEVRGVNAVQLFFEGLPLLRFFSHEPCMWWMQVVNALWLATAAGIVALLCTSLVGTPASATAIAAFLCSPFVLMCQILPVPTVCFVLAALLVTLPLRFYESGSPAVLALLGAVAGLSATIPSLTGMAGLALLIVGLRLWRGERVSKLALWTAGLSFVAIVVPNIPSWEALQAAYDWFVFKHWPWSTGQLTLQGQLSPSEASWTTVDPPGLLPIALGSLLSPFAIARNSLRNWGDVLFEPLSAALAAVGLLVCLRQARRDRTSLYLIGFLVASLIPGFVSSYDRTSLTRIYGETVSLAVLSAAGLMTVLSAFRNRSVRQWAAALTTVAIAVGGLILFDVVNQRILSASTWGLLMRSVDEESLGRVAMLTANGKALNPPDVDPRFKLWEPDWLLAYHPYIEDLARCAPRRPVPIIPVQSIQELQSYDILFWGPALDQTIEITERHICVVWPEATLYTIFDRAGLSKVHAAQIRDTGWEPSVPRAQWSTTRCGANGSSLPDRS